MNNNTSKKAPSTKGETKSKKTTSAAPAAVPTQALTRVVGERISGETLNGKIDVIVKRRTLKTESKVGLIRRLLTTPGQTKESITFAAEALHTGSEKALINTINTVRADLRRVVGAQVVATGWRTDEKSYKAPTAAVAKLRTHQIGGNAFSQGAIVVPIVEKTAKAPKVKAEVKAEDKPAETPVTPDKETLPEPPAEITVPAEDEDDGE